MIETNKYIIEIPDNTAWLQWVNVTDKEGNICFDYKYPENLTPYTEPDIEQVRKEAYQKGLNDAWEVTRKISMMDLPTRQKLFKSIALENVFAESGVAEALEKIRQYEQEKEEQIQVGDEVNGKGGRGTITKIGDDSDHFNVMWENGSTGYYMREDFKKTGRNFPEIGEVLKKMQEGK